MNFIRIITTKTLTLKQEKEMTLSIQNLFKQYLNDDHFMIQIEDNQVMYYNSKEIECIRLDIYLKEHYPQTFKNEMQSMIEQITDIPIVHQSIELFVSS